MACNATRSTPSNTSRGEPGHPAGSLDMGNLRVLVPILDGQELPMTDQADLLAEFSNALARRAEAAKNAIVAVRLAHGRHLTGMVWRSEIVVASEQSLPRKDDFELVAAGGAVVTARMAGRDPATNVAILRLAEPMASPSIAAGEAHTGAVALAIGADGTGAASARLGLVNLAGAEWHSSRGGLIDRRIVLDLRLARREEGGPVFDSAGACLGMSTFGPRGQVIAIPTATIERIVPLLLKNGRIPRGWLGVALASRRGARCAARDRRPVQRLDGHVGRCTTAPRRKPALWRATSS